MADFERPAEAEQGQNVNLILKSEERHPDEVVVSFPMVFRKMKKYFVAWLLTSIILGGIIVGVSIIFSATSLTPVEALVSFSYDGIEKGKDPKGGTFNAYGMLANAGVIQEALETRGMDPSLVEAVRQGIDIDSIIPPDAVDKLTTYGHLYEEAASGQLNAAQQMLATTWYSTQYKITFNFHDVGISREDAVQLVNAILDSFRTYFFKKYGYNDPLGVALLSGDYTEYDYAEALDRFNDTLRALKRYINNLAADDSTRFRSTVTGYTFADVRESITAVQNLDIAMIDSFISANNISKDPVRLQGYYEYRTQELNRQIKTQEEHLATVKSLLDGYQKDQIIIFSDTATNTQSSIASDEYDKLINRVSSASNDIAESKQAIEYYNDRLAQLNQNSNSSGSKVARVEKDLEKLNEKINTMIEVTKQTADDYFENVSLANAYNVLVPATSDAYSVIRTGIKKVLYPVVGLEMVLFLVYIGTAMVQAILQDYRRRHPAAAAADAGAEAGDDPDPEKSAEDKKEKPAKQKKS